MQVPVPCKISKEYYSNGSITVSMYELLFNSEKHFCCLSAGLINSVWFSINFMKGRIIHSYFRGYDLILIILRTGTINLRISSTLVLYSTIPETFLQRLSEFQPVLWRA